MIYQTVLKKLLTGGEKIIMNKKIIVLGAGMAGYGAAQKLKEEKVDFRMFEKNSYYGGHCASFTFEDKWVFDDGPHISFSKSEEVRDLFAKNVENDYSEFKANTNNYWKGKWITHPAQVNLYGLPPELNTKILSEMIELSKRDEVKIDNYEDWLYSSFGKTFSDNFPKKYTRKFHTTEAKNLTTDWVGPRLYKPKLEEVIYGMLTPTPSDVHYIKGFRYPNKGGFVSFMSGIKQTGQINYNCELTSINLSKKNMSFSNGEKINYNQVFSSLPLNQIIELMEDAPKDIKAAAARLSWTQCVVVNLGISRPNVWDHHWTYFYDEDLHTTRLSSPHLFSPQTVPLGCSSLQIEIYFSNKYKPLDRKPDDFIPIVIDEMIMCGILRPDDKVAFSNAWLSPYAQVIFDHDRKQAVETLHAFLLQNDIHYGGRYADWAYIWSDESYLAGKKAAESILEKI